ncbi:hypothetical protein GIB67_024113 [Kingdonia uniflora]|uniref:Uncharacterized protein n=1 Tax=Kingdonia uniflora TaxID=39325 RepID=A0A7J7MMN5_9MAGN|nr:hypothetical protein GIB67_024113 [Kingdonia uniflora]
MVKTRSQRAVEARVLNDLRLTFKIDKIREAVFGQQGYDVVLLETRAKYEGLVGHLSPVIGVGDEEDTVAELIEWPRLKGSRVEYPMGSSWFREFCKAKSSIDGIWGQAFAYGGNFFRTCIVSQGGDYLYLLPDLAKENKYRRLGDKVSLEYVQGIVKDSRTDGFCCYLAQFDYGLTLLLSNLAKNVMNLIGVCPVQLNCNFWEVIFVCETLNGRWAASGSEKGITAKDFMEYYVVKVSVERQPFMGINCKVSRKESFIDVVAREGTELVAVLKELEISRFKRVASKDDKVRRSQAKRRLVGKTPGSMEEKLTTSKLNIPLKLAQLNKIPDGPVDMATVSSTAVQNLAKRKAVKRGAASRSVSSLDESSKRWKVISPTKLQEMLEENDKIAEGADLRPCFEVEANLVEEQCRAKAREKMVAVMDEEFKKLEREKEKEAGALKLKQFRAESEAEVERLVTASAISRNNLAGKLYQLRYTKAEITTFSEGNYEEMKIMDEEEVEEREDGLNTAEKTNADNQETINQEIENSCLRVVDLEGLLEVEKKSSAKLQKELDTAKEREEQTLLYNAEYAEEYEALISQDLVLNQLTNELAELKEKAMSSSRDEAELAEYRIRASNEEIFDMKCNIRALNELLLKREIDLDTARTNLVVSEANFEKLSSSILGKDRELGNSEQIRDSLIVRLDRLKADLRRLKGKEAQSRADLVKIQAKNQN